MKNTNSAAKKSNSPGWEKFSSVCKTTGKVLCGIGHWIYNLRSIFLAVPVALAALYLAVFNRTNLPEMVGIDLQSSGNYAQLIERDTMVFWPLVITAASLVLMFCSRRIIYPWIISIFTLVIPILIYITNVFPA